VWVPWPVAYANRTHTALRGPPSHWASGWQPQFFEARRIQWRRFSGMHERFRAGFVCLPFLNYSLWSLPTCRRVFATVSVVRPFPSSIAKVMGHPLF
jgi:hypothetical protein